LQLIIITYKLLLRDMAISMPAERIPPQPIGMVM